VGVHHRREAGPPKPGQRGVFNLLPLLPLDGGHIAVAWFQRLRKADPGTVSSAKLLPLTYTGALILCGFTLLTVAADIVNPISILK